ncbi:MAG: hypothetical protein GX446_09420 [Chthonomonadales bacterium]|nr:hypothetical protein [Chthonomonadales bacterium]
MFSRVATSTAAAVLFFMAAWQSSIAQATYEGFDYDPTISLSGRDGGTGWNSPWFTGDPFPMGPWYTRADGLSFLGMAATGRSVSPYSDGDCGAARGVQVGGTGLTTYFSWLVRVPAAGDQHVETGFLANAAAFAIGLIQESGGDMAFVLGSDPDLAYEIVPSGGAQTYLITGSLYVDPMSAGHVTASLWADPFAPLSVLNLDISGDWSGGIEAIWLGSAGSSGYVLDEIYLGAEPRNPVVPEASSVLALLSMLGMGGVGLLRRHGTMRPR